MNARRLSHICFILAAAIVVLTVTLVAATPWPPSCSRERTRLCVEDD